MIEAGAIGEQAPCPTCGFPLHFERGPHPWSRLEPACDQCPRNAQRVSLGLEPLTMLDERPIPPPSKRERVAFEREQAAMSGPDRLDRDAKSGRLAERYLSGESTVVLGRDYHVMPTTVRMRLYALKVPLRATFGGAPSKAIPNIHELAAEHKNGTTVALICSREGLSPNTLRARFRAIGHDTLRHERGKDQAAA